MAVYIWRIWCTVEGAYFEVASESAPANHGGHAIDTNKTVILGLLNSDKAETGTGRHVQAIFTEPDTLCWAAILNTSWTTIGSLRFPGTNEWTPIALKAVMEKDVCGSSYKHDVRLWDVTHSLQICALGMTLLADDPTIYAVTAFANLPAEESVFEVQVRSAHSSYDGKIYWVDLVG